MPLLQLSQIAGLHFFGLQQGSRHPWVRAMNDSRVEFFRSVVEREQMIQALDKNIHEWQPHNASEYLGVSAGCSNELRNCPPWAAVLPWEPFSIDESIARQAQGRLHDTQQYGVSLDISEGSEAFGPSSSAVVRLCAERLMTILTKMQKTGLRPRAGRLRVVELSSTRMRGLYRSSHFYVENGQHRAAVYSYLRVKRVSCKIVARHEMAQIRTWPGVRRGYFDETSAESVFNRIVEQEGPLNQIL